MKIIEYGKPEADIVLVQPIGEHDLAGLEQEIARIRELADRDFHWIGFQVDDWNQDLAPWRAPAVFDNEDFGDGASAVLDVILQHCGDPDKTYYLGGYSLAGLFSLWAAYQTDRFRGIAAASPSVWFPGFDAYMQEHELQSRRIYLSLGTKGGGISMRLIKLPFRLLALLIIPVIAVLSIFYKLFLNLSSMVIGFGYLVLAVCLVVAITEHSLLAVAVVMGFGLVGFLAVMFAEAVSLGLDAVVGMLAGFIFS